MIKKIKSIIKKSVLGKTEKPVESNTPEHSDDNYTGVPAAVIAPKDEWFNPPVLTEKGLDYMEKETLIKKEIGDDFSVESNDIHQRMYEIATKNHDTKLSIDPPGGSENFQSKNLKWNSGTGYGQFRN